MARSQTGLELIAHAYRRADTEGETERHPQADVLRYVNQGGAELWDLLVEARGRTYYRSATPWTITTVADTTFYTSGYPTDFYRLLSVRLNVDGRRDPLLNVTTQEESALLDRSAQYPTHYDLRPTGLLLLPEHPAGLSIVVDYVRNFVDLTTGTSFDGINGWEEYIVCFAARCMATKDAEWELVRSIDADMDRLRARIKRLAPTRDAFRPERVQDVRGPRMLRNLRWRP